MMATANQKFHINKIYTMAAKLLQQQNLSLPTNLKINDRVSPVHADTQVTQKKHIISASCNCEAVHGVCAP